MIEEIDEISLKNSSTIKKTKKDKKNESFELQLGSDLDRINDFD
jgi:hypothetical protein